MSQSSQIPIIENENLYSTGWTNTLLNLFNDNEYLQTVHAIRIMKTLTAMNFIPPKEIIDRLIGILEKIEDSPDLIDAIMEFLLTLKDNHKGFSATEIKYLYLPLQDWRLFYSIIASLNYYYTKATLVEEKYNKIPILNTRSLFGYYLEVFENRPKDQTHPLKLMLDSNRNSQKNAILIITSILHQTTDILFKQLLSLLNIILSIHDELKVKVEMLPLLWSEFKQLKYKQRIQFLTEFQNGRPKSLVIRYILEEITKSKFNSTKIIKMGTTNAFTDMNELINTFYHSPVPYSLLSNIAVNIEDMNQSLEFFVCGISQFLSSTIYQLDTETSYSQSQPLDWLDIQSKTNNFIESINNEKKYAVNIPFIDSQLRSMSFLIRVKLQKLS